MQKKLIQLIAEENGLKISGVRESVKLLDKGNTIPFIARYRKEMTGNINEKQLRKIAERMEYLRRLENRKEEVIDLIAEQGKLTPELKEKILSATIIQEVEDYYRPYRQKRRTRAARAREKGLKPLAKLIWNQEINKSRCKKILQKYLDPKKDLKTDEDIFNGVRDIIAEWISDRPEFRKKIRKITFDSGWIESSLRKKADDEKARYKIYYDYKEGIGKIPAHRILALNRGETEEILQVKVRAPEEKILFFLQEQIITGSGFCANQLGKAIKDAYKRLLEPSVAREVRSVLTAKAEKHAVGVFAANLRNLLLQPPLRDRKIMGIDPAYRTGCKIAAVNERGELLTTATIYPHPPHNKKEKAKKIIKQIVTNYNLDSAAIGNGTASRETELLISGLISEGMGIDYAIVNEAGASVYSASELAAAELPELDVTMRGAVSIARRIQDPLAELVKISPRSLGVGLYQHDINQKNLKETLQAVVESTVNYVGVDVNTASPALLQYVAGINSSVADDIVEYREEKGCFNFREELKNVYGLGPKTYEQAAGFIRINSERDPLARTPIHPESYRETERLIRSLGYEINSILDEEKLTELREELDSLDVRHEAKKLDIGIPTLRDIIKSLKQPGRDPREKLPGPIFRTDVLTLEDLEEGMIVQGTIRNVVDFGAFVDIGVKEDGLIHISELSPGYVKDPGDIVVVGEQVQVKILDVDRQRRRISLSLK